MSTTTRPPRVAMWTLLIACLVVYSAQGMLVPILAPMTRLVGLGEVDLGVIMTLAAAMLVVTGPAWGRLAARRGVQTVLVRGLVLSTVGMTGFAITVEIAAHTDVPRVVLLPLLAVFRGVLYGIGIAAVPVAALTYLASISSTVDERTRAMGAFGAVQGIALIAGPALGGALAFGALLLPVQAAPVLMVATLAAVLFLPRREPATVTEGLPLSWKDRRVLPFLVAGGSMFLGLGLIEIALGFFVQDRLGLSDTETAAAVAVAGVALGIAFAVSQAVIAPRTGLSPWGLITVGAAISIAGYVGAMFVFDFGWLVVVMMVVAVGLGFAIPGYHAGATLAVDDHEHAAISGLLTATAGITYVLGPISGTALYSVGSTLPLVGAIVLTAVAVAVALREHVRTPVVD